jgi:hypothetical protein
LSRGAALLDRFHEELGELDVVPEPAAAAGADR